MWKGGYYRAFLIRNYIKMFQGAVGSELPIVTIVNDPDLTPECMGYLFKNDSFYGPYKHEVIEMENCLQIAGIYLTIYYTIVTPSNINFVFGNNI